MPGLFRVVALWGMGPNIPLPFLRSRLFSLVLSRQSISIGVGGIRHVNYGELKGVYGHGQSLQAYISISYAVEVGEGSVVSLDDETPT